MNIETIETIENILNAEKEKIKKEAREKYESGEHTIFEIGDWVTDGKRIGRVQRIIENGYINVDLKNNNGGCLCQTKANNFFSLEPNIVQYLEEEQEIRIHFTGEDIEAFFMSYAGLRNFNPSKTKDKLISALEAVRLNIEGN